MERKEVASIERTELMPRVFDFEKNEVRILLGKDGEPWFVAKDVATILGYLRPENAVAVHCRAKEKYNLGYSPNQGGTPIVTIIPERDVYRLIMRSKLPSAERFEEWVVGEVLPGIRKTGHFSIEEVGRKDLALMIIQAEEELEATRGQVKRLAPKAKAWDETCEDGTAMSLSAAAKELKHLGVGPRTIFRKLSERGVIYRLDGDWVPKQVYMERGFFKVTRVNVVIDGEPRSHSKTLVTPKGRDFLVRMLSPWDAEGREVINI